MWLACWTLDEIAEAEGVDAKTVRELLGEFPDLEKLGKLDKANADHATDFDPPIYNIWKQQTKSESSSHFGNSNDRCRQENQITGVPANR